MWKRKYHPLITYINELSSISHLKKQHTTWWSKETVEKQSNWHIIVWKMLQKLWDSSGPWLEQWWPFLEDLPKRSKEVRITSKAWQVSIASVKVSDSIRWRELGKNCIHGGVPRQKPHICQKNPILMIPKIKNILWTHKTKVLEHKKLKREISLTRQKNFFFTHLYIYILFWRLLLFQNKLISRAGKTS